jgi:WD40 repeat protein
MLNAAEAYRLVQGHFDERSEVWGLAVHPSSHKFITCGDDMTVRLWDGKTMQQIEIVNIGSKARAVAFRPDGSQIAVATFEGKVHILSSNLQTVIAVVTIAASWIQAMSYSPDGGLLGVGSHDDVVYLLETKSYSTKFKFKGHHSFITALDFSVDGSRLQSVSGDYELLFWDCNSGRQVLSATEMRDTRWARFTCTLGWPVQGIWPPGADGTDVNSVDCSPCGKYLASGDDFRRVKLFRYPCPKEGSKYRECKGHAEHVTNVRFSYDSKYVYSVGGLDKAVLQFEVKPMSIASNKK